MVVEWLDYFSEVVVSGLVQLTGLDLWMQKAAPAPSIPL